MTKIFIDKVKLFQAFFLKGWLEKSFVTDLESQYES